jgi:hypothetical protein
VLGAVVGDVLAESLLAGAGEPDGRRLAGEVARDVERAQLEVVALDGEGKVADGVVETHKAENATATSPASRALAIASVRFTSRVSSSRPIVQQRKDERRHRLSRDALTRRFGDRIRDEVTDLDRLRRRVREEEAARSELPMRSCDAGCGSGALDALRHGGPPSAS